MTDSTLSLGGFPKRIKLYAHRDKESNWSKGEQIGLSEEAIQENFVYALYEVEFDVEVQENGETRIIAVGGKAIAK